MAFSRERKCWYLIVEVTWGKQVMQETPCSFNNLLEQDGAISKGGLKTVRLCTFHIDHTCARHRAEVTRAWIKDMLAMCLRCEVDFLGGDGNAATYSYLNGQSTPWMGRSNLAMMLERARLAWNEKVMRSVPSQLEPYSLTPMGCFWTTSW